MHSDFLHVHCLLRCGCSRAHTECPRLSERLHLFDEFVCVEVFNYFWLYVLKVLRCPMMFELRKQFSIVVADVVDMLSWIFFAY